MPTLAELRQAVESLLQHPAAAALLQLNSNTRERAFEAYVLGLCMEAVRRAGGTATIVGINTGDNPNPIVFRGAPGDMSSKSQDFAYVRCQIQARSFELHLDIQYEGTSTASHEIDVSAYSASKAAQVRGNGLVPKASGKHLILALECKFYDDAAPGVALCRTFVGLLSDCSGVRLAGFVSNLSSKSIERYLSPQRRPNPFLSLIPADTDAEERLIRRVEQELRQWVGAS